MASVLVHIVADGVVPDEASLRVLGEGRRICTSLGATLHAYVQLAGADGAALETIARSLGGGGADKVIVNRAPSWQGPPLWSTHGDGLQAACEELRPLLVLMASGATGGELAPRLAATLGAAYIAEPVLEHGSRGELVFSRYVYGRTHARRLAAEEVEQTVVITLPANRYARSTGEDEAELRVIDRTPPDSGVEYVDQTPDPRSELDTARVVVVAGAGVQSFETFALVERLASALGGVVAATRSLCEKGIAPAESEIGVGARELAPELFVICGASGSSATLGALAGAPEIVAIDRNPDAPIFRVANYGLVGNLETVLPDLIAAIRDKGPR